MEEWDFQAVVRGFNGNVEAGESSNYNFAPFRVAEERFILVDDKIELYKPCFYPLTPKTVLASSFSVPQDSKTTQNRIKQSAVSTGSEVSQESHNRTGEIIKSKKSKKNLQKRVVQQMDEAGLSTDKWAWRKYGQKPIKGSPHPRSYYRCSSSKGCLARKQVERNPLNPEIFIVTFTNEHSHELPSRRNSLAGSTRIKPTMPKSSVKEESQAPSITSLDSDHLIQQKSVEPIDSDKISRDCDVLSSDMMLKDEIFLDWENLEEFLTGKEFSFDDCFYD